MRVRDKSTDANPVLISSARNALTQLLELTVCLCWRLFQHPATDSNPPVCTPSADPFNSIRQSNLIQHRIVFGSCRPLSILVENLPDRPILRERAVCDQGQAHFRLGTRLARYSVSPDECGRKAETEARRSFSQVRP